MTSVSDRGVVLRRLDYSETSQVLALFTRTHGKVRAIAKGAKRSTKTRFEPGIDLLDVGHVSLSLRSTRHDSLATLTEWKQMPGFARLRGELPRVECALYAAEITASLTEDHDPHPLLFDALIDLLSSLSSEEEALPAIVHYQRQLLVDIGLHPQVDACVKCGRSDTLSHFSSIEGGVVCRACAAHLRERHAISAETLGLLRVMRDYEEREPQADRPPGQQPHTAVPTDPAVRSPHIGVFRLYNYHLTHLMHKEPLLARPMLRRLGTHR